MPATIAAVRYACDGEASQQFSSILPVKVYNLQATHNIFQYGHVSDISRRIGMPLVVEPIRPSLMEVTRRINFGPGKRGSEMPRNGDARQHGPETAYASYDGANYFPNDTAAHLMVACSAGTDTPLLHPPREWQTKVGSVIVARQDMVPLHPLHIEVLKAFIKVLHHSLVERSEGRGITEDAINETVTPEMWQTYWKSAADLLVKEGRGSELIGVAVPFDVPVAAEAQEDNDEGGVHINGDSDMMECSDVGFAQ